MVNLTNDQVDYLLSPVAIRERCQKVWDLTKKDKTHFHIDEEKIEQCADFVFEVIKENYPKLDIPFHSRWGHFQMNGIDRIEILKEKTSNFDKLEKARIELDLVIVSVLLDAGAGPDWSYEDPYSKMRTARSEGLALASFDMFLDGAFSNNETLKADYQKLKTISENEITEGFQVTENNPLIGIQGRTTLLSNLGKTIENNSEFFPGGRPGNILDYLINKHGHEFEVKDILFAVLRGLGSIWPGRIEANGINLGDCWKYDLGSDDEFDNLVVFHKLSQWLTYSLVSPMVEAGLEVSGAEKLTGLAEYRNGGLFLDLEVIKLKDPNLLSQKHLPNSELIIEWRALTICLLDIMGEKIQEKLNLSPAQFPLAKVLEGGTWHAGRKIAKLKRTNGTPPLQLESDGTVF